MKQQRVVEAEVRVAVRSQSLASLDEVEAVVLETDGSFNVVKRGDAADKSALQMTNSDEQRTKKRMKEITRVLAAFCRSVFILHPSAFILLKLWV